MFRFLGSRGVAIVGLVVGLAGTVAGAPDAVGTSAANVAGHIASAVGLLLAAFGGSVSKPAQ